MRAYSAADEEALRARRLLKEWADDGDISKEQKEVLAKEVVCDLRTTNVFLRVVLFVFSLFAVGAFVGLFFIGAHPSGGGVFLFFAVLCYAAAEVAVSQARLHHYGIEEALAVISVGFLCVGLEIILSSHGGYWSSSSGSLFPFSAVGAVASLWIWYRFNLWYALLAAMVFTYFLPMSWTLSDPAAQLVSVAAIYAAGLVCVALIGARHRFEYLENVYSLAEAFLWLGIYLLLNLKISELFLLLGWGHMGTQSFEEFARPFYWSTWVIVWCLPPVILWRGARWKDRFVIAVGLICAILTLVTNKPYLGWQRHTWDPMLLGVALTVVVWLVRRSLARGPEGVRWGFTAERLSGRDERWLSVSSTALGMAAPHLVTPSPQPQSAEFKFGGGESDGGGASGDF